MSELKDRIKELMVAENLSQYQFAKMIDISPASLSSIFNDRSRPTLNHVRAIRQAFPAINPAWLLDGEGEMFLAGGVADTVAGVTDIAAGVTDIAAEGPTLFDFPNDGAQEPLPTPVIKTTSPAETMVAKPVIKEVKVVETKVRRITEIRIFYDDQTWETFVPEK